MKRDKNLVKKEIFELAEEGFSCNHLSRKYGYDIQLIKSWISKQKKLENSYNSDHVEEKYIINKEFYDQVKPKSILDLYCGRSRFWASNYGKICKVVSNDNLKDPNANPDYKMTIDADKLLQAYLSVDYHFDLIDVDPYGSPKDCISAAIKLADKGLIITFGDFKNCCKRFSTEEKNYFYDFYGISLPKKNITIDHLAEFVIKLSNNKFKVWGIADWRNCDRIYFIKNEKEG